MIVQGLIFQFLSTNCFFIENLTNITTYILLDTHTGELKPINQLTLTHLSATIHVIAGEHIPLCVHISGLN